MVHVMWGFCWRPISKVSSTPRETCSNPSIPPEPSRHPKKTSEKSAWTGLVRKITNEAIEEVKVRHNRSLEKVYPVVFFDCIVVRRLGSDFFDWDFSGSFWTSVAWLIETCGTKVIFKKKLIDWSSTCSVEEVGGKDDDDRPRPTTTTTIPPPPPQQQQQHQHQQQQQQHQQQQQQHQHQQQQQQHQHQQQQQQQQHHHHHHHQKHHHHQQQQHQPPPRRKTISFKIRTNRRIRPPCQGGNCIEYSATCWGARRAASTDWSNCYPSEN